jgi:peptidoglycan/LPS O-acetylase OafA/YrhL
MNAPSMVPRTSAIAATGNKPEYNLALGYLRAFVIVLVVAHHAALAYHPFAPPPHALLTIKPHWWQAFPIVDSQRSNLLALLVGFNDVFFMSLMFFLSGLFVWNSLHRKRAAIFLQDRLRRLGLPFVIAAGVLAPLAYYPSFLQTSAPGGMAGFWHQWLSLGEWPAGPAWFLWVLFVFDCVAATLFVFVPKLIQALSRLTASLSRRPAVFFAVLVSISAVVYVPMSLVFPIKWSAFGPFTFQTSRIFHYLLYFLIAVALGALPNLGALLAPGSKLRRRWPLWTLFALFAFILETVSVIAAVSAHIGSTRWAAFAGFTFSLSCGASCFAFLAIFLRFANTRVRLFDSLRENSYGIYLLHYFCVSWLQYVLLTARLPGLVKGSIVFLGALILSWTLTASLRRIPAVARTI